MYNYKSIGRFKSEEAATFLSGKFPDVQVTALTKNFEESMCKNIDLIVDSTDNFDCKLLSSRVASKFKINCIVGSIYKFQAQIYIFLNQSSPPLCLENVFKRNIQQDSCSTLGVYASHCTIVGGMVCQEAINIVIGKSSISRFIQFNSYNYKSINVPIKSMIVRAPTNIKADTSLAMQIELKKALEQGTQIYDVRDRDDFEHSPSKFKNVPWTKIMNNDDPKEFIGAAFICKSGIRAKACAEHINLKTGTNECSFIK